MRRRHRGVRTGPHDLYLAIPVRDCTRDAVDELHEVLAGYPGNVRVHVVLTSSDHATDLVLGREYRVAPSADLLDEIFDTPFRPVARTDGR